MIIVTGGAGFIGSNLVKSLNNRGHEDIIVVDDMTDGTKFINIADCKITDYLDKDDFIAKIKADTKFSRAISALFHQGACTKTTEWDGKFMMNENYEYSKTLLYYCLQHEIPFLYASSASVYGKGPVFKEDPANENALNVYAYSKLLFDQQVRKILPNTKSQVAGFRYFNVYGPREQHKGSMASVAYHFNNQILKDKVVKLFVGSDGYDDGEQRRDFVYVDDVVNVNLWFLEHPEKSGIFNLGSGKCQSFNDVANAVIAFHDKGKVDYVPFPNHLKGRYQSFTEADIHNLREAGYHQKFKTVEEGVTAYMACINNK